MEHQRNRSEVIGTQTRGIRSRLGGYVYECNVAALRMVDVLRNRASSVVLEHRYSNSDTFDDLKVITPAEVHAYQVKWGMHAKDDLTWRMFDGSNHGRRDDFNLCVLLEIFITLNDMHPDKRVILHIYTTRRPNPEDMLVSLLRETTDPALLRFCDGDESSTMVLDANSTSELLPQLAEHDLRQLLGNLVIEVGQPQCPSSQEQEKQIGHPMRQLLFDRLCGLGLDEPPHQLLVDDVYDRLVGSAIQQAIFGDPVTSDWVERRLGIGLDTAAIPQDFPFDKARAVISPLQGVLRDKLGVDDHIRIVALVGPPGSGKSWALTAFATDWDQGRGAPIHYCFERPQGDNYLSERATEEAAVANIIAAVRSQYPDLSCFDTPNYGATKHQLEHVLECLSQQVHQTSASPVIIDGLDHAVRTLEHQYGKTIESSVLELLKNLVVPSGVRIIVGTQEVDFLDELQLARGHDLETIDMPPLGEREVHSLLQNEGAFCRSDNGLDEIATEVARLSKGLPLYVHYAAATLRQVGSSNMDELRKALTDLPSLPIDRDIYDYYDYLWNNAPRLAHELMFRLAVLEFFVTKSELEEHIFPQAERLVLSLEPEWQKLRPLLQFRGEQLALFHDSFRRFLLDRFAGLDEKSKRQLSANIVRFLETHHFYESDRAFRHMWQYLVMADRQHEVCDAANLETIDFAIGVGRSASEIGTILNTALEAAADIDHSTATARIGFLLSYLRQRFENLPPLEFARAAGALGQQHIVQRFLDEQVFGGHDHDSFLGLLEHASREHWAIDGRRLLMKWRKGLRRNREYELHIDIDAFVRVLALWEGGRTSVQWIRRSVDKTNQEISIGEVYLTLTEFRRIQDLELERRYARSKSRRAALECLIAAAEGSAGSLTQPVIDDAIELLAAWGAVRVAKLLIQNGAIASLLSELVPFDSVLFAVPERVSGIDDTEIYESVQTGLRLATVKADKIELQSASTWLHTLPNSYIKAFAKLGVVLGIAQGTLDRGQQPHLDDVREAFERLILWKDGPGTKPSAMDFWGLRMVSRELCSDAVSLIMHKGISGESRKLLTFIEKVLAESSSALEADDGTSATLSIVFEVVEHAIGQSNTPASREALLPICQAIENHIYQTVGLETGRARRLLDVSRLWATAGGMEDAKRVFHLAVQASYAHGWRKDVVLFSVGDLADALNSIDPASWTHRLQQFDELVEWIDVTTDGDETRHLPSALFRYTADHSLADAVYLLRRFEDERDPWSYNNCLRHLVSNKNVEPAIRCLILSTISDEFDEPRAAPRAMIDVWRDETVQGGSLAPTLASYVQNHIRCALPDGVNRNAIHATFEQLANRSSAELATIDLDALLPNAERSTAFPDSIESISAEKYTNQLCDLSVEDLLHERSPSGLEHLLEEELVNRAANVHPDEVLHWLEQTDYPHSMGPTLRQHAAHRFRATDPQKAIQILVDGYSESWGWFSAFFGRKWALARAAIDIDPVVALKLLRDNYVEALLETPWAGRSGFEALGKILVEADQTDAAQEVYEEIVSLCQAMFRTFPQPVSDYAWLGLAARYAVPVLPSTPEHEVLAKRLLIHELDVHTMASAAIRTALDWVPTFASSLIDVLPQLKTVHSRTAALVALRFVRLTDEQRDHLVTELVGENRLPVLLEAEHLQVPVHFPPSAPIISVSSPHPLEQRLWPAVMPLAQQEFNDVARLLDEEPDELRTLFAHRIAAQNWDAIRATELQHRYVHPNYHQIPYESVELQLVMDELYRLAASKYPLLTLDRRHALMTLVTHDDPQLQIPAFSCPPLAADDVPPRGPSVRPFVDGGEAWIPLAMQREECSTWDSRFDTMDTRSSWFVVSPEVRLSDRH